MQVSGYRPRTIKDYDTFLLNFAKGSGITDREEVTMETNYSWLDSMKVVNQTKLTRLKVLKSILNKCFTNGWLRMELLAINLEDHLAMNYVTKFLMLYDICKVSSTLIRFTSVK